MADGVGGWGWGWGGLILGDVQAYADKVLATQSADLIAYWPLWEAAGATVDNYEGTAARDGAYDGPTLGETGIGDGETCIKCDGDADRVNLYSASLAGVFDVDAGSVMIWFKMNSATEWEDSLIHCAAVLRASGGNEVILRKTAANDTFNAIYVANEVWNIGTYTTSRVDWINVILTWDTVADEVNLYIDGSLEDGPLTSLGEWDGSLHEDYVNAGVYDKWYSHDWYGWLAHLAVWTTALSAGEALSLATV